MHFLKCKTENGKYEMKRSTLIFVAAVLLPIGSLAADKNGRYRITYGPDHGSCEAFLLARNECNHGRCADLKTFSDWLMGYITSYNSSAPDTFDIVANTNLKSVNRRLEYFCKQDPSNYFEAAVKKLMVELYPTRQEIRPEPYIETPKWKPPSTPARLTTTTAALKQVRDGPPP